MLRFVVARLAVLIPTFLGVTIVAFVLIRLMPGDPIELLVGERGIDAGAACHAAGPARPRPAALAAVRGLHRRPAQGDLGRSISTRQPVLSEFLTLFPATIELSVCALALAVLIGLPAGIIAGVRRGSAFDQTLMGDLADRLLDADLLVGPAADHPVLQHAPLDAGVGAASTSSTSSSR